MGPSSVGSVIGETFLPTREDLVRVARSAGRAETTPRTIRYWRSRGLVSEPTRTTSGYRYPLAALAEVDGIARWGFKAKTADLLTFARYIEAGTVAPAEARDACISTLSRFRPGAEEARELQASEPHLIKTKASELARLRGGRSLLPRRVRVPFEQRVAAIGYVMNALSDNTEFTQDDAGGLASLQRIIGLRGGRGGMERDLSDVMPTADEWRFDLGTLVTAVERASDDALECARRSVEMVCVWSPALLALATPYVTAADVAFLDIASDLVNSIDPIFYVGLFSARLTHRFNECPADELATVLAAPRLLTVIAEWLVDQPAETVATVRLALRPFQRAQLAIARRAATGLG